MVIFFCLHYLFLFSQIEKQVNRVKPHNGSVSDVQLSQDLTMLITASKDNYAKVF